MARFQPPRATRDLLPADAALRKHIERQFAQVAETYGFQPIQTPAFENVELFATRSGPEIKSSMLTFHCDHEELALRPEMTAPVCRLVSAGVLDHASTPHKLYYVAPCFRYCRPGSGRYREFIQAGIECIGEAGPDADAEVIAAICRFLDAIGITDRTLRIGNIGIFGQLLRDDLDPEDRAIVIGHLDRLMGIRERCRALGQSGDRLLLDEFEDRSHGPWPRYRSSPTIPGPNRSRFGSLSAWRSWRRSCRGKPRPPIAVFGTYRTLVPKPAADLLIEISRLQGPLAEVDQKARALLSGTAATGALDELLSVCRRVEQYGQHEPEVVLGIARGFTFYTSTVFEVASANAHGIRKYCGGGRYDRLIGEFGGPDLQATGCAVRFDSLVDEVRSGGAWSMPRPYELFLLAESDSVLAETIELAETLRARGRRIGLAVGSQTHPTAADCETHGTERIGLVSGKPNAEILVSDGTSSRAVAADADALAAEFER